MNELVQQPAELPRGSSGLDRLIVVVENWRHLVFWPFLVGLAAYGVCFVWPQSYTSYAILAVPVATGNAVQLTQTPAQASAMLVSPLVLDPVISTYGLADGRTVEKARKKLAEKIHSTVGKDNLLRLEVTASSPELAQKMSNTIIDLWLKTTAPGQTERADLEKKLQNAQKSLDSVNRLLTRLTEEDIGALSKPLTRGEAGNSLVGIGELQTRYLTEVLSIPRAIQGLSRDVVAQAPTLPIEPSAPKKGLIAGMAAVVTFFLVLVSLFLRRSWNDASTEPAIAQRQQALLAALGLRARVQ